MFKILSWNIRQGGGKRVLGILKAIIEQKADVVILSEFHNNQQGIILRTKLLASGYLYQVATGAKASENSVLIVSKFPCDGKLFPEAENFPHGIAMAGFPAFNVYGLYLPHKKKHTLFDLMLNEIDKGTSAIFAGDFNTGKNYVDQKGNSFWYTDQLEKMEKKGYLDAFRYLHKDKREYSWYSHQGNGYRYDHTYVHESIAPLIKACYYLHEHRENKLSDHAPMMLEFGG